MFTFRGSDAMSSATRGRWSRCEPVSGGKRGFQMVTWEMADGTEMRYEGAVVEPAALREFVVRFMSAQGVSRTRPTGARTHWLLPSRSGLHRAWMFAANSAPTGPGNS